MVIWCEKYLLSARLAPLKIDEMIAFLSQIKIIISELFCTLMVTLTNTIREEKLTFVSRFQLYARAYVRIWTLRPWNKRRPVFLFCTVNILAIASIRSGAKICSGVCPQAITCSERQKVFWQGTSRKNDSFKELGSKWVYFRAKWRSLCLFIILKIFLRSGFENWITSLGEYHLWNITRYSQF